MENKEILVFDEIKMDSTDLGISPNAAVIGGFCGGGCVADGCLCGCACF